MHGLSLVAASAGFSLQRLLLLQNAGSRHAGFSSCGSFFFIFFIEVELIYNVVATSAVQQSDSVIHTYTFFFILFSVMVYPRILNIVPCAMQ